VRADIDGMARHRAMLSTSMARTCSPARANSCPWIDLALPARGDQHIGLPWVLGGQPQHLKVQGQVIQRKREDWSACSATAPRRRGAAHASWQTQTLQITCEAGNARATWR
jgi:hypothetical protein